jgi:hypothetical protein
MFVSSQPYADLLLSLDAERGTEPRALARRLQRLVGLLAAGERNTSVRVLPPQYFG